MFCRNVLPGHIGRDTLVVAHHVAQGTSYEGENVCMLYQELLVGTQNFIRCDIVHRNIC